jgi:hypothetical protein
MKLRLKMTCASQFFIIHVHFPYNDCILNAIKARLEEICANPMIAIKIHKAVTPERIFQKRVSGLTQAHVHS